MLKSDLFQVILAMNDEEIREAKKFLLSPYFNKREDVVRLFELLASLKKKPPSVFSKEKAFDSVFPKAVFDDALMRHTMSYLLQLLYRFLSIRTYENDENQQQLDLYKSLKIKNLEKQFEKKIAEGVEKINQKPLRDIQYHFSQYQWQFERNAAIFRKRRTGEMHLMEMTKEFTIYYFSEALRHGCLLVSHQNLSKQTYDLSFFEEILTWVEKQDFTKILAVAVYYHSFLALTRPAEQTNFFQLKKLLTENYLAFQEEEIRDLYRIAINYCIKQQNRGEVIFIREGFELYKSGLENHLLLENGVLSVFTYKNIHQLADKLGEFDWIVVFLEKYKAFLPAEHRENHYNFNLAQYYFRRKNYEKAMPMLQTIDFSDVLHNLDARKMLMMMYFDLAEYEALETLMENFKTYLLRQQNIGYHRDNYSNFLKFIKKLLLLNSMKKKEINALKKEINDCESVAERGWLLEKMELGQ
jgi:hypothetical protein